MSDAFYKFSDIVFPIVRIRIGKDSKAEYLNFLGSGFYIGNEGYFLTANHVLNEKLFHDLKENEKFAIQHYDGNFQLYMIDYVEDNAEKLDVSLGHVDFKPLNKNFFKITSDSE